MWNLDYSLIKIINYLIISRKWVLKYFKRIDKDQLLFFQYYINWNLLNKHLNID